MERYTVNLVDVTAFPALKKNLKYEMTSKTSKAIILVNNFIRIYQPPWIALLDSLSQIKTQNSPEYHLTISQTLPSTQLTTFRSYKNHPRPVVLTAPPPSKPFAPTSHP
jgi:hypothetical protein